ncbi:hypothetical protein KS4_35550 [Poriferisphaera corsica]|uniref:Uncharacterized protein n=1 Tax=Poriferisphaera corsica TaxID=2528020 RepID=A0A517YZ23_9BACT|nr:hypothetical protein KS4_35550 [Poriferisphaera corsica]
MIKGFPREYVALLVNMKCFLFKVIPSLSDGGEDPKKGKLTV